jgi:hypothetical protein
MAISANQSTKVGCITGTYIIEGAKLLPEHPGGNELRMFRRKHPGTKPVDYLMVTRHGVGIKFISSMYPDGESFTLEHERVYYRMVIDGARATITRKP